MAWTASSLDSSDMRDKRYVFVDGAAARECFGMPFHHIGKCQVAFVLGARTRFPRLKLLIRQFLTSKLVSDIEVS